MGEGKVQITTRDFGTIEVEKESILTFKQPIFGFEEYTKYVLISDADMGSGICWLQSVENQDICFILMDPQEITPDYAPSISQEALLTLQAVPQDPLDCWVITVIGKTFQESTVNLKSPILMNHKTNYAMQIILEQDYPIRQRIFNGEG